MKGNDEITGFWGNILNTLTGSVIDDDKIGRAHV